MRVGTLEVGQLVRPCVGLAPRTVEGVEPDAESPARLMATLRGPRGERQAGPHHCKACWHGDWADGRDPDEGQAAWTSSGRYRSEPATRGWMAADAVADPPFGHGPDEPLSRVLQDRDSIDIR